MKQKILTIITVGSIFIMTLTGCGDFSYRNPAKSDTTTYVAELPDGSQVEITKEEAEEIRNIQEEFGVIASEYENEDYEEDYEEESETDIETEEIFDIKEALGEHIGDFESLGVKYSIYANGAEIKYMNEYADNTIPEEIEYEGVIYPIVSLASIPYGVTEFNIPSHIKYIRGAFSGTSIETVTIPETIEYFEGYHAFSGCESLKNVTFLGEIETDYGGWEYAFSGCKSLEEVTIPEGVTCLGQAFNWTLGKCSVTSVSLPDSLTTIGPSTFSHCENLETVVIPQNVETIYGYVFANSGIKYIDIPESVNYLDMDSFDSCSNLEELYIPDIETIERSSLENMDNLKVLRLAHADDIYRLEAPKLELVIFPDDTEEIDINFFNYVTDKSSLTIQVPEKTVEYFQNKFPEINVVAKE